MVERRNFGTGTCPEPGCGTEARLTAKGLIRQHGPRTNPCPGTGREPLENQSADGTATEPADVVDNRPTASEFRRAQVALGAPGETVPEGTRRELTEIVRMATEHGVRPDPEPTHDSSAAAEVDRAEQTAERAQAQEMVDKIAVWNTYRTWEQAQARDMIGEPGGPGEGTVKWAETAVAYAPAGPPLNWTERAVQILAATDLDTLSVLARERVQDSRLAANPNAPRDYALEIMLNARREQGPNPHRPPLPTAPAPVGAPVESNGAPAYLNRELGIPLQAAQQAVMDARRDAGAAGELARLRQAQAIVNDPEFPDVPGAEAAVETLAQPHANGYGAAALGQALGAPMPAPNWGTPDQMAHAQALGAPDIRISAATFGTPTDLTSRPLFRAATEPEPDVATVKGGAALRPGPEDKDFDQWGRYKIPDPVTGKLQGRQRVTTFAKAISDQWGLSQWQQRVLLIGAAQNPIIAQAASKLDAKRDREALDNLADTLKDSAGARAAAAHGTHVHTLTEHGDMGLMTETEWSGIEEPIRRDLTAYQRKLAEAGLVALPDMVERTTIVRSLEVAGTLDRILRLPNGDHVIGDVKTGQDLTYGWLDIGIQLACYAHGVNENGVWDWGTRSWNPNGRPPRVRTDYAIVMHVPAGQGVAKLYRVDLETGWAHAALALKVREARKLRTLAVELDLSAPEFQQSRGLDGGVPNPLPLPLPPVETAGLAAQDSAAWHATQDVNGHDAPRRDLFTPAQNAALDLAVQGATLAQTADPLDEMRRYAREAMTRAIDGTPADKARIYDTALRTFPAGDPVFAELARIGSEPAY